MLDSNSSPKLATNHLSYFQLSLSVHYRVKLTWGIQIRLFSVVSFFTARCCA